ncbi:MAG: S8 family serine peptidase [Elusimicrobia bacterium]|nr:S8 family serine peptidase [Elusimicrobiota bacterium]
MRLSRLLVAASLLASSLPARALETEMFTPTGARVTSGPISYEVVSGEAMVRFSSGTTVAEKRARLAAAGMTFANEVSITDWTRVLLPTGTPVAQGLDALSFVPGVAESAPNHAYRPVRSPNDPLLNSQYALSQVSALAAWEYEIGSSNLVTVAVGDTGIDRTHPDLSAKLLLTTSQFCDPGASKIIGGDNSACVAQAATDACGHGTSVAGVAAASTDNGAGISGMSWGARLVSLKIFRDADCVGGCSAGACTTDDQAVADAIAAAQALHNTAAHGKIVLNLSVGGNTACPAVVQAAVTAAVAAGVVIVASAGNSPACSGANVNSPARCVGVIPAAATTSSDQVASYSCPGPELASFGVAAPGSSVLSTSNDGGTASVTGTSFSAPMVSGLAALVYSQKPNFTPAQIQNAIRAGAETIGASANSQGAGRINAYRTLRYAVNGTFAGFDGELKPIAFPNPFKPSEIGTVAFAIPPSLNGARLGIKIYTLDGTFVREVNGLSWNGKNTEGNAVASGTYVFVVTTSAGTGSGRLSVLR